MSRTLLRVSTCCIAFALIASVAFAIRIRVVDRDTWLPGIDEAGNADFENGRDGNRSVVRANTRTHNVFLRVTGRTNNESGSRQVYDDEGDINDYLHYELQGLFDGYDVCDIESRAVVARNGRARLRATGELCYDEELDVVN